MIFINRLRLICIIRGRQSGIEPRGMRLTNLLNESSRLGTGRIEVGGGREWKRLVNRIGTLLETGLDAEYSSNETNNAIPPALVLIIAINDKEERGEREK